jgi:hypothetical protein
VVAARHELLSLLDPIREVRRRDIERAHAGMQSRERIGVVGWWDLSTGHGFVVGPQRDHEAITFIDAWLHPRLKGSHRRPGFGEPLSKLDFELQILMRYGCHPGQDVTRQQTQSELVRVMQNDRVVDCQIK